MMNAAEATKAMSELKQGSGVVAYRRWELENSRIDAEFEDYLASTYAPTLKADETRTIYVTAMIASGFGTYAEIEKQYPDLVKEAMENKAEQNA